MKFWWWTWTMENGELQNCIVKEKVHKSVLVLAEWKC